MINTPSSKPYIYQQLLSNSKLIRVLDVDPAQTSTAAIVGRLRVVDLATSSRFTALSYVWSSSEPDQTIECNGMNVAVSANGHSALQHLRTSLGSYTIWIDALCINQADTKEKEHQVSLMGDIYSRATNVYVWLGEGDDSSDRVMEYMRTAGFLHYFAGCTNNKKGLSQLCLAALSGSMARYSLTRHPFPLRASPGTWIGPLGPTVVRLWNGNPSYVTLRDVENLLHYKWITRLWTYQEILLAVNPTVVCGRAHVPWDRFAMSLIFLDTAIESLRRHLLPWKRVALSRQQLMAAANVPPNLGISSSLERYEVFTRRFCKAHFIASSTLDILFVISSIMALILGLNQPTNPFASYQSSALPPSILVMAALSIAAYFFARYQALGSHFRPFKVDHVCVDDLIDGTYHREAKNPKDMAFGLWAVLQRRTQSVMPRVDYGESKETIYTVFSRLLVEATGSPHLLLIAAMDNMEGQPSWAPNWASEEKHDSDWRDVEHIIRSNHGADSLKRRTADNIRISMLDKLAVCVRGRRYGAVVATFVFQKTQCSYQQSEFCQHVNNLKRMVQLLDAWDTTWLYHTNAASHNRLDRWRRHLIKHRNRDIYELLSFLRVAPKHGNRNASASRDPELLRTHIAVCNALARDGQVLFQGSAPGTLIPASIGWCRRDVKDGDLIVRCPGVQIPLIVRPCPDGGNDVQIKSIAYTPDYMNRAGFSKSVYKRLPGRLWTGKPVETELEEFHVY
ncbi:unnamed protein product [Alternaria burnsii]|nr:unnamed protein product [Alternaria burnsii]